MDITDTYFLHIIQEIDHHATGGYPIIINPTNASTNNALTAK